ncbi:MAG: hypothetical protein IJU91_03525 [Selenomonadaceae bacterium]|nr:hypothetical protein [Selenomonadaceae bacterium]
MRISAFVDCDSESAVIRVPYKLLADMVKNCPPSDDLDELKEWLCRMRSAKLHELLEEPSRND